MKTTKRIFALLLCVLMCVSLVPTAALAEDGADFADAAEETEASEPAAAEEAPAEEPEEAIPGAEPEQPAEEATAEEAAVPEETVTNDAAADYYSGTCGAEGDGSNVTWHISGTTLYIEGTGPMANYTCYESHSVWGDKYGSTAPWDEYNYCISIVKIFDGVTSIGDYAFWHNYYLDSVHIAGSVESIGEDAFEYTSELMTVIFDESGSVAIGERAFYGCESLTSIEFPLILTSVGEYAFVGCPCVTVCGTCGASKYYVINGDGVLKINGKGKMDDYAVDSTELNNWSYQPWKNYTDSITTVEIGEQITGIGRAAFLNCYKLTSVTIPQSITEIPDYAFCNCSALTDLEIPEWITKFGYRAFYNSPCLLSSGACGNTVQYVLLSSGQLFIYGYGGGGDMYTSWKATTSRPGWESQKSNITRVYILDGITNVGLYAFYGCENLKSVTIPEGVTYIGHYAFYGCKNLKSVTIPDSVETIYGHAFYGCTNLQTAQFGSTYLKSQLYCIDVSAFDQCKNLTSADLPQSLTSIGDYAFRATGLKSVTFRYNVKETGYYSFSQCTALESVTFGMNVTTIEEGAFSGCTSLRSVTIPENVTTIGDSAFKSCEALNDVTIGSGVTALGVQSFCNCSALNIVGFEGNAPTIDSSAFQYDTLTAYYPPDDTTWTNAVKQNYGGTITWQPTQPVITAQPTAATGCLGDTVSFTVKAVGFSLNYAWLRSDDGGESWSILTYVPGTCTTLEITLDAEHKDSLWMCEVNDQYGNYVLTTPVGVTILPKITQPIQNISAPIGDTVQFNISATGIDLTYQWYMSRDNGSTWSTVWDKDYLYRTVNAADDGLMLRCVVTDYQGNTASSTAKLTVIFEAGDVNYDGSVTLMDLLVLKHAIAAGTADTLRKDCADVDGDGYILMSDVTELQEKLAD